MALARRVPPGLDWRLRDLPLAILLGLVLLVPLTYAALPLLLASRWHQVTLGVVLEALAIVPAVALVARWRGARHLRELGLGRYPLWRCLGIGVACGLGIFIVVQGCGVLMERLGSRPPAARLLTEALISPRSPGRLLVFLAVAVLVAPFWEELFFRGFAYPVLRRRLGAVPGVILSALFFALLHAEPFLLRLPIFILGILLALIYERTGSLYAPMAAHAVANTLSTLLFYAGFR